MNNAFPVSAEFTTTGKFENKSELYSFVVRMRNTDTVTVTPVSKGISVGSQHVEFTYIGNRQTPELLSYVFDKLRILYSTPFSFVEMPNMSNVGGAGGGITPLYCSSGFNTKPDWEIGLKPVIGYLLTKATRKSTWDDLEIMIALAILSDTTILPQSANGTVRNKPAVILTETHTLKLIADKFAIKYNLEEVINKSRNGNIDYVLLEENVYKATRRDTFMNIHSMTYTEDR